jgi:hypothetical protein
LSPNLNPPKPCPLTLAYVYIGAKQSRSSLIIWENNIDVSNDLNIQKLDKIKNHMQVQNSNNDKNHIHNDNKNNNDSNDYNAIRHNGINNDGNNDDNRPISIPNGRYDNSGFIHKNGGPDPDLNGGLNPDPNGGPNPSLNGGPTPYPDSLHSSSIHSGSYGGSSSEILESDDSPDMIKVDEYMYI